MNPLIRRFFRTLRVLLGPVMLLKERLTRPTAVRRAPEQQADIARQCKDGLALYQFQTCPFCIKVRQEMYCLSLPISPLNAQPEGPHRAALLQGSGATKVPCLKITDASGAVRWLGDSGAIIGYLRGRFNAPQA